MTCEQVTGCIHLSEQAGNELARLPDGLYVPAAAGTIVGGGDGITVTGDTLGGYTATAALAPVGANAVRLGTDDGLYAPACPATGITATADTPTLSTGIDAGVLTADVQVSPAAGNTLTAHPDGLYASDAGSENPAELVSPLPGNGLRVWPGDGGLFLPTCPNAPPAGAGLLFDPATGYAVGAGAGIAVGADTVSLALSADAGNAAALGSDSGLYVAAGGCPIAAVDNTDTIALTLAGGVLSAAVKRSADPGNALALHANGVWVPSPSAPPAAAFISADANNQLRAGSDAKLYVPTPPARPIAGGGLSDDGTTFAVAAGQGLTITGTEPADTLAVKRSADPGNQVRFGGDGGLYAPAGLVGHAVTSLLRANPADMAVPANTNATPFLVKAGTTGVVDDQSNGKITYMPNAGNWQVATRMHLGIEVSASVIATDTATLTAIYIGLITPQGWLRERTQVSNTQWGWVCFGGCFTTAGAFVIELEVVNIAGTTAFTLRRDQVNVQITWLGDA